MLNNEWIRLQHKSKHSNATLQAVWNSECYIFSVGPVLPSRETMPSSWCRCGYVEYTIYAISRIPISLPNLTFMIKKQDIVFNQTTGFCLSWLWNISMFKFFTSLYFVFDNYVNIVYNYQSCMKYIWHTCITFFTSLTD